MIENSIAQIEINDSSRIQYIVETWVKKAADGKPGIKEQDWEYLNESRKDYKRMLNYYQNRGIIGKNLSKTDIERLKSIGFIGNLNEDEAFVGYELMDGLSAAFGYLKGVDPKKVRDSETIENINEAVKANREMVDFFIKIEKRFKLGEKVGDYFYKVFGEANFQKEFASLGCDNFPFGVAAAVRAYLFLKKTMPEGETVVSSTDEDRDWGVDLVWRSKESKRFFEVKGDVRRQVTELFNLKKTEDLQRLDLIDTSKPERERQGRIKAREKIKEYARQKQGEAWWIEAPSRW